uniref:Ras-related protein Rab-7b n=1 Tax=Arcella intermedia TaxID=1963864 RepID=A0A6B2LI28_9EUKA
MLKVIILGDQSVGKTSLLHQYTHNKFSNQYKATIGTDFLSKEIIVLDYLVTLQLWDTAGQERFHCLNRSFYRGADCCVLVFDVNLEPSFKNIENWYSSFNEQASIDVPLNFPFLVIGNKVDMGEEARAVSTKKAQEWCRERGDILYFETSAKEAINIDQAFRAVAQKAVQMMGFQDDPSKVMEVYDEPIIYVNDPTSKDRSDCSCPLK